MQTSGDLREFDTADFVATKQKLQARLGELEDELNRLLARQYGVMAEDRKAYQQWLTSHQPFHWFTEFYGNLKRGGFDVIIGNPPYVEYSKVQKTYRLLYYETLETGNLFAYLMERVLQISRNSGYTGLIVQLSGFSTPRMRVLNELINKDGRNFLSFFECRPGKLFEGIDVRFI